MFVFHSPDKGLVWYLMTEDLRKVYNLHSTALKSAVFVKPLEPHWQLPNTCNPGSILLSDILMTQTDIGDLDVIVVL